MYSEERMANIFLTHLGFLMINILPNSTQQLAQALKAVIVVGSEQLEKAVVHDVFG